jgi:hypothetical protein
MFPRLVKGHSRRASRLRWSGGFAQSPLDVVGYGNTASEGPAEVILVPIGTQRKPSPLFSPEGKEVVYRLAPLVGYTRSRGV